MSKSRNALQDALNHRSGRIPFDCGSTPTTGIHVSCVAALRQHYGLENRPIKVHEPYQMLGTVDEDLQGAMGLDIVGIGGRNTIFGFPNENWHEVKLPWGQVVLVSEHFQTSVDRKGDWLLYPEGDRDAPPSGRMPASGFFFDSIVRQVPIVEDDLDPADNLEEFTLATEADTEHFRREVAGIANTSRGRICNVGGTAFGDIALVPAPFLKHPKGIRDVEEWYVSTVTRQDYIHEVFSRQCEIALANLGTYYQIIGDEADVLFVCGTDLGTQQSTFCSPQTYDSLYAPYHKAVNDWVHEHTPWKTFKHSCGAVKTLIPGLIKAGFDILNPVQCSAAGMNPEDLKAEYGKDIVFWGGGVDTQKTLPFGTPDDVREEVLERCGVFSRDGGFVFNTVHNIQAKTPTPNIVAMVDALKAFNGSS